MIINLPKIGPVRFADNISPEEFQSQLQALSKKYDFKIPKPDVGIGTLLKRGFMRGLGETGIALGDVLPAMGASALGFEDYAQRQLDEAAASRAELERKYPTQFKSYTEVSSPFEALQFGAETLGELGPTALTAMIPGLGAGALGSRLAARGAMGAAMEAGPLSLAGRAAAETAAKKAAETAGRRAMYGGVYLGSFAQNAPEVFESIYRETDKMEPGIAALAGGISSILDSVVPGKVLDSLGSYGKLKVIEQVAKESGAAPKVWKYIGKEAAKTAGQEGLTEAAQESINAAAEQVAGSAKGVLDPENIQRYKEAFVKGAVGGSAFGAVSGTSQGLTARKEFRDTKEAEAALKAQMDAEAKAGTLTPERRAEYDIALENARKQREAELEEAFRDTRESEMARMEQIRPAGGYAPDAETQAEIDKMEAEYAKKQEEQQKIDAEKAAGSAFSKVPPTPGTGGLYSPAVEQKRAEQQAATRQFAFGPVATTTPGDPITYDTLKDLKIAERSKVGQQLVGLDLATPDGRRTFIQTIENPGFTGNIDGAVYDDIIATFDPKEVETARAEMKAEVLSPTKQKQQDQTRAFAFGAPDVTRPDAAPVGTSTDVSGAPAGAAPTTAAETIEPSGVVSAGATPEQPAGREGQQPGALTPYEQGKLAAQESPNIDAYRSPYKEGTPEHEQWMAGVLDIKYPSSSKKKAAPARDYAEQVLAKYDSLPEAQRDAVAAKLGLTRSQLIESEAIFNRTEEVDDAIAEIRRQPAPAAPASITPPAAPRSAFARPELPTDLATVQQKLGTKGAKLDQQATDAKAYFGKVTPELALDAIANDLVYQPTAYRNAKMKLPSVSKPGTAAPTPEPMFGTQTEAEFFKGQGGVHAKNAEAWARANLSPEAVAYLDQKIAQYQKEAERSSKARAKQQKQQDIRKGTKTQVKDEAAAAQAEGEYAPTLEEIEDAKGTKTLAGKRKKSLQRLARELSRQDPYADLDDIADTDISGFNADETLAAVHTQAHPAILNQLENGNFVGALQGLADSASSEIASRIADLLAGKVGNVKVVYGAQRSMYDPKTNTIYLREGATEYEILHEGTHAALSHVLDNPSHPVTREIMALFNQLKANVDGAYGAQDIQEFTAEAWSNEEFRNRLREFKPDGQKFTGWERLVNAVRRMFGFPAKHESAYDKLDRLMAEIISPPPETRTGKSLYAQSLGVPNFAQMTMNKLDKGLAKVPHLTADRRTAVWAMLENLTMPMRTLFYKSLNLSAMAEVGTKYFGDRARQFSDQVNEMAGYQEKMLESLQPMHERLTKYRNEQPERHAAFHALINDATIPDIRPYPESESMYRGGGKHAEYLALRNRFIKLTPDEQKLYRDYFATFKALDKEFEKSLKGNLEGAVEDKQRALSAYDKIMQELAALRVDHYAPLFREGQYWLAYNLNGQPVKRMLGTQVERTAARREAEAQGGTDFEEYSRVEQIDYTNVPDGTMLASIMKIMKDSGAGEDDINKLIQLVVQALPETSILKSRQQRTGVAGYMNDNAAYVFDRVTSNSVRQIARMRYGQQIKQTLAKMREDQSKLKGDASADAAEMLKDLAGRYEFAMNPRIANYAQYASTGAFYWNLAGNVSSALVNILQTPMVVLPQLGGKYGFGASTAALNNARKLYMGSGTSREVQELGGGTSTQKAMYSIENMINSPQGARYKGLVEAMKSHGLLQTSTARDALNSENNNDSAYGPANKLARVTTLVGTFMFHHAERFNRETTAVAAYDLEMQRLKNSKMSDAEKQDAAIREAIRMVEYTHGAGSTLAGPSLGQSDIGKILMVFKRFAFSMYYMLFDTMRRSLPLPENATAEQREAVKAARRQLAGIYGMAAIFAGAKGLPMYWVAEMAYNAFQDEDDDDFDTVMRQYLGEFLYKGPVNYFTNLSIADRVGWTDLIFRENKGDRADASAVTQFLEGMLGAPYSIILNAEKGMKLVAEGQWDRGIETMLPAAIKNVLKGGRYALEGANTLRGDAVMGDISGYNAAMQVLGFAPADLLKQYEENAYLTGKQKAITGTEKKLLKQYYMAMREGDGERMSEIETKLYELGDKYPELGISGETIRKSVANRDRISANMYHGVQLNEKLRARLEGAASTVYD